MLSRVFDPTHPPEKPMPTRRVCPGTFRFLEQTNPCSYWCDGHHRVTDGECRCGSIFELIQHGTVKTAEIDPRVRAGAAATPPAQEKSRLKHFAIISPQGVQVGCSWALDQEKADKNLEDRGDTAKLMDQAECKECIDRLREEGEAE